MERQGNRGKLFARGLPLLLFKNTDKKKAQSKTLGFFKTLLRLIGVCGFPAIAFCFIYTSNQHAH
ncbi:hypothetical protein BTO01_15980 [Vibrio jasicida]|nr:hypothetical protein BTO01_15980 [Vibrio jasicida]